MRGPVPRRLVLQVEQIEIVRQHLARGKTERRVADRCRILLLSHDGVVPGEVAQRVGRGESTIHRIRGRFFEHGLDDALFDRPRSGRPPAFSPSAGRSNRLACLHSTKPA